MNTNHCRREAQDSSLPSTRAVLIGLGLVYCLSLNAGPADAHVSYTGTTLTNGNGAFLDRETVRKDLALTVTGHAAQNAASAGVGVATGLPADNDTFSSYSNVGGVVSSRLDTTVQANDGWINGVNNGADSHLVKFFGVELNTTSNVSLFAEAVTGIGTALGDLIPSISVYRGKGPYQAHDEAPIPVDYNADGLPDPFDPNQSGTPLYTFAPGQTGVFFATQDSTMWNHPADRYNVAGLQADYAAGNLSVDRDNNGVITQADVALMAPEIGTLEYLDHIFNSTNPSVAWNGTLGPGFYTFLVGGSNVNALGGTNNRGLRVNFEAAPVPLPAAAWLFGSGVAAVAALARRRRHA